MTTKVLSGMFMTFILSVIAAPAAWADSAGGEDAMLQAISGDGGEAAGRRVRYFDDDPEASGYLALPEGDGPFPAVILIHEWNGVVERIQQVADAFAKQGYIAFAADLYSGRTGTSREENMALVREVRADEDRIIANLDAAAEYVRENTPSTGRVATVGWCFGGGVALSYALGGERHEGTAIFYGSLIDDPEAMQHVHHEIYGTFAREDRSPALEEVNAFVAAMREAGIDNDVHIYDDVQHGFWLHVERDPGHNRPAAEHAWQRLKDYLERTLD